MLVFVELFRWSTAVMTSAAHIGACKEEGGMWSRCLHLEYDQDDIINAVFTVYPKAKKISYAFATHMKYD